MPAPRVTFRAVDGLQKELIERTGSEAEAELSETARRDLGRYYELLGRELRGVQLSEGEASLVAEVCSGWWVEGGPEPWRFLWAEVADGIRLSALDQKWSVDGQALVAKIQAWTPGQILAVVDAAERFWRLSRAEPGAPTADLLARVGLVRKPVS